MLRAYLTTPIDNTPSNDTASLTMDIRPDIKIAVMPITDGLNTINCIPRGTEINQSVTITNTGNMDVADIPLVLEIWGSDTVPLYTFYDTLKGTLQKGGDTTFTFKESFTVPVEESYNVVVKAELDSDVNPSDNINTIIECVARNDDDIALIKLFRPAGYCDCLDVKIYLGVAIKNWSLDKTFDSVVIHAVISDGYSPNTTLTNMIPYIAPDTILNYMFAEYYTVPYAANYTINVFIDNIDDNPLNDTLRVVRPTCLCSDIANHNAKDFILGQNIPNPAKDNTQIEYNIPSDGQVIFTVYSITGQTLHIEKKDVHSGKNNIEFNISNLANGIYYYSMEYKGERLVKKMTIQK
jgi:hypothetical protein